MSIYLVSSVYIRPRPHSQSSSASGCSSVSLSSAYYVKPICPSGGHGRGHRLALQNRAAARHTYR